MKILKKSPQIDSTGDIEIIKKQYSDVCTKIKNIKKEYGLGKRVSEHTLLLKAIQQEQQPMKKVRAISISKKGKKGYGKLVVSSDLSLFFLLRHKSYIEGIMSVRMNEIAGDDDG